MADQKVKDWRRQARSVIHRYPEIKQKTKDATNSDTWGPTDAQKQEIAQASFNDEDRALIMKALWKRISDTSEYWQHVYKALDVLEYLLLVDSPGIVNELRFHDQMLSHLVHYNHAKGEDSKETEALNDKVRIKSKRLLNLVANAELLSTEREKLRLIMERLGGGNNMVMPPRQSPPTSRSGSVSGPTSGRAPGGRNTFGAGGAQTPPAELVGGGAQFELDMDVLQQLVEMGFEDQDAAMKACLAADNNLDRAVAYLLSQKELGRSPTTSQPPPPQQPQRQPQQVTATQPPPPAKPKNDMPDLFGGSTTPPRSQSPPPNNGGGAPSTNLFDNPALWSGAGGQQPPPQQPAKYQPSLWDNQPQRVTPPSQPVASPASGTSSTGGGGGFDPFADLVKEDLHRPAAGQPAPQSPSTGIDFFADARQQQRKTSNTGQQFATAQQQPPQQPRPTTHDDLFGPSTPAAQTATPTTTGVAQQNPSKASPTPAGGKGHLESKMMADFLSMGQPKKPKEKNEKSLEELMRSSH